jgi:hypothetical protein
VLKARVHTRRLLLGAGLLWVSSALASNVGLELGGTAGQATDTSASTGTLLVRALGDIDFSDQISLHLDAAYTRALAQAPPPGFTIGSSGGNVFSFDVGLDLAVLENALFSFDINFSPSSTVEQQVAATLGNLSFKPLVSSQSKALGGTLAFGISTGFHRPVEASFDSALAVTRIDSAQQIVNRSGNPIPPSVCATAAPRYRSLCALLVSAHGTDFTQSRLSAGATVTLFQKTDVSLSGAYYFYSSDPTQVGFFALATGGRLPANLGEPLPLVPVLWSIRPGLAHRFGEAFSLGVYYEFSDSYAAEGTTNLVGLRLALRAGASVRLVLRLEGQSFTDTRGVTSLSGSAVLSTRVEL